MPAKRAAAGGNTAVSAPVLNALLLAAAAGYGLWLLVARGRVSWPPHELLASLFTISGCIALVGPILLARRDTDESGLGDLQWLAGGVLIWIFDVAAVLRGETARLSWATPLAAMPMGLTMLAILLAGWRTGGRFGSWSWTNITGWLLGLFWVGLGLASLVPTR
jgi:hypothetical protein